MSQPIDVRGPLDEIASGRAIVASFASIPNAEVKLMMRDMIQKTADDMGLEIVIRDSTDPWITVADNQLYVMRFEDYKEAYGLADLPTVG